MPLVCRACRTRFPRLCLKFLPVRIFVDRRGEQRPRDRSGLNVHPLCEAREFERLLVIESDVETFHGTRLARDVTSRAPSAAALAALVGFLEQQEDDGAAHEP